ncbi:MAG: IPT/TIG domain-containing protein [Fidelibacterota bacterium]
MKRFTLILGLITIGLFSCESPNYPEKIYNDNPDVLPDPVITSIAPADSAFAGIGILTITGENFGSDINRCQIYFNGNPGEIQSLSATELVVKAPNLVADSVKIQISVIGAYEFAEWDNYKLFPAVVSWGGFDPLGTNLWAIAIDNSENLFVSESENREILRVFPNGEADSVTFAAHSAKQKAIGMRYYAANSSLILAMSHKNIYEVDEGNDANNIVRLPSNTRAYDLDFDSYGNMYAGGRRNVLYRINLGAGESSFTSAVTFPDDVHLNAIRVFEDYVYVIGEYIGSDTTAVLYGIYRTAIVSSDSLGPVELLLDWEAALGADATKPFDLTFALDGTLIVGVDYIDPSSLASLGPALYKVSPPYADATPEPIYAEVLPAPATKLTWGNNNYLYVNSRNTATVPDGASWDYNPVNYKGLFRVDMTKQGAPYYGRTN